MRLNCKKLLAMLLMMGLALPALAAKKDKTKGLPEARSTPVPSNQPVVDAKGKLSVAQGNVERAQDAMNGVLAQLRKEALASPAVAQAAAELKQAQEEYDAAEAPLLAKVRATKEYDSALEGKKAAAQRVLDLQAAEPPNQEEITAAAKVVLEKGHVVTRMETEALGGDPKIAALKEKLHQANVKLLRARFEAEQSIKSNPQLAEARKAVEDAQAQIAPLQNAYESAQQQYDAQVAQANSQQERTSRARNVSTSNYKGKKMNAKNKKKLIGE